MKAFLIFARLLDPKLYDMIQPYAVTRGRTQEEADALMPEEYRFSNPKGRPLHDDWALFKGVRRMDCAYRIPLPYRIKSGTKKQEWMLFDPSYPMAPEHQVKVEDGLTYVLTDRAGYGLVTYEAWIPHLKEWRPVFVKYTGLWFGKRLSWYKGLHQDNHVSPPHVTADGKIRSDLMCWFPELAMSWIKES